MNQNAKAKINWWKIVAAASIILCLYTTWMYAETKSRLDHLLEHQSHEHGAEHHHDHDHPHDHDHDQDTNRNAAPVR